MSLCDRLIVLFYINHLNHHIPIRLQFWGCVVISMTTVIAAKTDLYMSYSMSYHNPKYLKISQIYVRVRVSVCLCARS